MKKGDIYQAFLDPVIGNEQGGNRPVLIISGNTLNTLANVVIIVPISSKIKFYEGDPILEPNDTNGLKEQSELFVLHTKSIAKERLKKRIGSVEPEVLKQIYNSLTDIFEL